VADLPTRHVLSNDGTPIAVFQSGEGPPIVLVHGAAADHTTFRVVGPRLAERATIHAIDRRGRGASGDTEPYAIEREYEDVAAVADDAARNASVPVTVVGHSFGGRVGLGAARLTNAIARLVVYEGAPPAAEQPYERSDAAARLAELGDAGENERLLVTFLGEVVGMTEGELAAYRANPVWPDRVAAAPTVVRELIAGASPEAGLEALGTLSIPVLQLLGSDSRSSFAAATGALNGRLPNGRVVRIMGAKHAAHHTHPDQFIEAVLAFIQEPVTPDPIRR
jgi:pimeloyl-ACP methyl ester carboxylesterase